MEGPPAANKTMKDPPAGTEALLASRIQLTICSIRMFLNVFLLPALHSLRQHSATTYCDSLLQQPTTRTDGSVKYLSSAPFGALEMKCSYGNLFAYFLAVFVTVRRALEASPCWHTQAPKLPLGVVGARPQPCSSPNSLLSVGA